MNAQTPDPKRPEDPSAPTSKKMETPSNSSTNPAPKRRRFLRLVGLIAAAAALIIGVLWIVRSFRTVSTDDAYVNSYVTFVAPRVTGQVARVLVDDNNRVKKGDVLVELDPEPYRVQVAIKQAAVDAAQADLVAAQATVRSLVAQARGQRFKLIHAIEDVDNQVALVRARVATWEQSKAALVLAQAEFDRAKRLLGEQSGERRGI